MQGVKGKQRPGLKITAGGRKHGDGIEPQGGRTPLGKRGQSKNQNTAENWSLEWWLKDLALLQGTTPPVLTLRGKLQLHSGAL